MTSSDPTTCSSRDRPRLAQRLRSSRWVLLVGMAIQAAVGFVAARIYLAQHNTLAANGRWISTKTQLARGLMGAFAFVTELQPLAGGQLDLGGWHGFQEIIYREKVEGLQRLELNFALAPRAYLVILLIEDDSGRAHGVRLSTVDRQPSALLTLSGEGEFLEQVPFPEAMVEVGVLKPVRLELGPQKLEVFIDGRLVGSFATGPLHVDRLGFRGSDNPVILDDIRMTLASGRVLTEDFDAPAGVLRLTLAAVAVVVAFNLLIALGLFRFSRASDRTLGFSLILANLTLLAIAGLLFGFVLLKARWYPGLDQNLEEAENYYRKGAAEQVLAEIGQRYPPSALRQDRFRILFLGTSQTWGAGALHDDERWVSQLERLLNDGRSGPPIDCINAGFSSLRAPDLLPIFERDLLPLKPQMLVIDLATNDRPSGAAFAVAVEGIVEAAIAGGARVVLIKEPNEVEHVDMAHFERFADLDRIAAQHGLPIIDMHSYLGAYQDSGFLWWDLVHLTSYGQRLMAEKLRLELEALGLGPEQPNRAWSRRPLTR